MATCMVNRTKTLDSESALVEYIASLKRERDELREENNELNCELAALRAQYENAKHDQRIWA